MKEAGRLERCHWGYLHYRMCMCMCMYVYDYVYVYVHVHVHVYVYVYVWLCACSGLNLTEILWVQRSRWWLGAVNKQAIIWTNVNHVVQYHMMSLGLNVLSFIKEVFRKGIQNHVNTLRQKDPHFPDDIFKFIFFNENVWISNTIWLNFVPKVPIDNNTQIMAWRRSGDKPLSELMIAYVGDGYMHHSASMS